jgi:hypothetical protein
MRTLLSKLSLLILLSLAISCSPTRNSDGTLKVVPQRFANLGNNLCQALTKNPTILKEAVKNVELSAVGFEKFAKVYVNAGTGKSELDSLAEKIVKNLDSSDATVAKAPVKGLYRSLEKTSIVYGGDANKLRDLIRNTIVSPASKIAEVKSLLSKNKAIVAQTFAGSDPLGYSGINSKYLTKNGTWGEIQVNTPGMIYAKENANTTRMILGDEKYEILRKKLQGFEPGLGHHYYEQWRSPATSEIKKAKIELESREYYNSIRKTLGE